MPKDFQDCCRDVCMAYSGVDFSDIERIGRNTDNQYSYECMELFYCSICRSSPEIKISLFDFSRTLVGNEIFKVKKELYIRACTLFVLLFDIYPLILSQNESDSTVLQTFFRSKKKVDHSLVIDLFGRLITDLSKTSIKNPPKMKVPISYLNSYELYYTIIYLFLKHNIIVDVNAFINPMSDTKSIALNLYGTDEAHIGEDLFRMICSKPSLIFQEMEKISKSLKIENAWWLKGQWQSLPPLTANTFFKHVRKGSVIRKFQIYHQICSIAPYFCAQSKSKILSNSIGNTMTIEASKDQNKRVSEEDLLVPSIQQGFFPKNLGQNAADAILKDAENKDNQDLKCKLMDPQEIEIMDIQQLMDLFPQNIPFKMKEKFAQILKQKKYNFKTYFFDFDNFCFKSRSSKETFASSMDDLKKKIPKQIKDEIKRLTDEIEATTAVTESYSQKNNSSIHSSLALELCSTENIIKYKGNRPWPKFAHIPNPSLEKNKTLLDLFPDKWVSETPIVIDGSNLATLPPQHRIRQTLRKYQDVGLPNVTLFDGEIIFHVIWQLCFQGCSESNRAPRRIFVTIPHQRISLPDDKQPDEVRVIGRDFLFQLLDAKVVILVQGRYVAACSHSVRRFCENKNVLAKLGKQNQGFSNFYLNDYEDVIVAKSAFDKKALVVSNDQFRDLLGEEGKWARSYRLGFELVFDEHGELGGNTEYPVKIELKDFTSKSNQELLRKQSGILPVNTSEIPMRRSSDSETILNITSRTPVEPFEDKNLDWKFNF